MSNPVFLYNNMINQSMKHCKVEEIPFAGLEGWIFDDNSGNLYHETGKYFSVEGMIVKTNYNKINEWMQPIINQPEVGILGLLTKVVNNKRYFLIQYKFEPGNVNIFQLSPTVQATESNFLLVHSGKKTKYLGYFLNNTSNIILYDHLQSEQGGRFYRKRNRNMVVEIDEDIDIDNDIFNWFSTDDLIKLFQIDNLINMDLRSVLCCIVKRKPVEESYKTNDEIINWVSKLKYNNKLDIEIIYLKDIKDWIKTEFEIKHTENKYFSVNAVKVDTKCREVNHWCQPMIKDHRLGFVGFIICYINETLHFLVQGKCEAGSFDKLLLGPTVQCSGYLQTLEHNQPEYLELFTNSSRDKIKYDVVQSEEGGRFYQIQDRHMIIEIDNHDDIEILDNYYWFSYNQLLDFIKHSYFNVEARSLFTCYNVIYQGKS